MSITTIQPRKHTWDFENDWTSGIFGCCNDVGTCCLIFWCCPCYACKLHSRTNECLCTPLLPSGSIALRTRIRTGFRVRGSVCGDACAMCFCPCCSIMQMAHELEFEGL